MEPALPIRIGTRRSLLARTQAGHMQAAICLALGHDPADADRVAPLVFITTTGDQVQDRRLLEIGGKAMFTKEIEQALLDGQIDVAVHSLKDVPFDQPPGLTLAAIPEREDCRDAFISPVAATLATLPPAARLGTASLRRQAQALAVRPDLSLDMLRGNVDSRLRRLDSGEFDAILLACAGLNRLGLSDRITDRLDPVAAPPAPGQGALALQTRLADAEAAWVGRLHDPATALTVAAERGALQALEGSCRTAMGAHAWIEADRVRLVVEALSGDGGRRWRAEGAAVAQPDAAHALGLELGHRIRAEAGDALIVA